MIGAEVRDHGEVEGRGHPRLVRARLLGTEQRMRTATPQGGSLEDAFGLLAKGLAKEQPGKVE